MRNIITANLFVHEGITFLVSYLYDDQGFVAGKLVKNVENEVTAAYELQQLAIANSYHIYEVWTSTIELYCTCLAFKELTPLLKEKSETSETAREFELVKERFVEIFSLEQQTKDKCKASVCYKFIKFIKQLGGF